MKPVRFSCFPFGSTLQRIGGQRTVTALVVVATFFTAGCAGKAPSIPGLFSVAQSQAASGRCADAIATYTTVLGMSPRNLRALAGRGSCYGQLGDYGKAIADYSTVTHATSSATDLATLAQYEWDAGYASQATADLAKASYLAGLDDDVGELLQVAGIQVSYSALAGAAVTLQRIPARARLAQWYLLSGTLEAGFSDVPAMTSDYATAIRLSPTSQLAPALVTAANAYWNLGHYNIALSYYERALKAEGSINRSQVYVQMGYAEDRIGSPIAAIADYRAALAQGLAGSTRQGTEFAIAADYALLREFPQARAALAPLLHGNLSAALRAEVNTLNAAIATSG